jgi:hypothetical protein
MEWIELVKVALMLLNAQSMTMKPQSTLILEVKQGRHNSCYTLSQAASPTSEDFVVAARVHGDVRHLYWARQSHQFP